MRRKEPSNITGLPDRRFTLCKSQILRGRQNFEELFASSSSLKAPNIILRYSTSPESGKQAVVGFIAPKRIGNAVRRNRIKRLLREAYRLNQHIINELPESAHIGLQFAFMAKHASLNFDVVQTEVVKLLHDLKERLLIDKITT